ncbi:MFS transporter [Devosia nitrariae]|uniref:MFS transporter n=1 Tax=Devosia nitrariae TaxID=2071872 RepID=UPI0024E182FD|nr:MFS transporter [Devosia nitrariae]
MTDILSRSRSVRNIALLSVAQALGGSSQAIVMSIAALTAASMAPSRAFATLPVTAMVIGLAFGTSPATYLVHRLGRTRGFMLAGMLAIPAAVLAAFAVVIQNFYLFCAALFVMGTTAAAFQQIRFAAADSVAEDMKGPAISWVMFGGVAAGFLGPQLSNISRDWVPGAPFAAGYLVMAGLALVSIGVLSQTRLAPTRQPGAAEPAGRPLAVLLRTSAIVVPIVGAAVSYALMTLIMVAAPLAMVYVCGHSPDAASGAIQWHIVAMFAPSFITGSIIKRIGAHLTAAIGLALIIACAVTTLNGITVAHFNAALILLGLGWNLGFIGSTALLTGAYRPQEAARVQAVNEQVVFGTMAVASIGSGLLLQLIGWEAINILAIPVAAFAILLLGWGDIARRRLQPAE